MHAAQDQVDKLTDAPTGLSAAVGEAFAALPPMLRAALVALVVVATVARWAVPALLRAFGEFLLTLKAIKDSTGSRDTLEALRIARGEQRRMIGRREAPEPQDETPDPKPAGGGEPRTGSRDDEPSGDAEDDPP
jgi:hypothetical protein